MRSLLKWLQRATTPAAATPVNQAKPVVHDPQLTHFIKRSIEAREKKASFEWIPGRFIAGKEHDGFPLSTALATQYAMPKQYLSKLVARHEIKVERRDEKTGEMKPFGFQNGLTVREGDIISLTGFRLPELKATEQVDWLTFHELPEQKQREHLQSLIIHEDDRIMIVNKPSGLSVQMGANLNTSIDTLFPRLINSNLLLVHRLDRDASGALIMAKSKPAATELRRRLDDAQIDPAIEKVYWTMCVGKPEMAIGEIYSNIYAVGRFPTERMTSHQHLRRSVTDTGKPAITQWRHLGTYIKKHASGRRVKLSMLEMRPLTGRKHQLRLHCAEQLKMPILGDAKYGYDKLKGACVSARPLHLHCYQIRLRKWKEGEEDLVVTAPLPQHWLRTMTDYPLFLPERPKLKKPQWKSNVRPYYNRFLN